MKPRFACWLLLVLTAIAPLARAQTVGQAVAQIQRERIQASYLLAFGRKASDAEVGYWSKQNPKSVAQLVGLHNTYLVRDEATHRETIRRSYQDTLGVAPKPEETKHWMSGGDNYTELVKKHLGWLKQNPAEYEKVIRRSYQSVLRRAPDGAELAYWKSQGTFSHAVLAACHEDWTKRNATTARVAGGKPTPAATSRYLATMAVSPTIATEARTAANLIGNDAGSIVGNAGGNIVAAGAGNLVAAGGGNIVAAGAGN